MKKLSLYVFLVLMFSSALTYAGGVKDFQIEGMGIGDSLLDYVNEEKIKKSIANHTQYDQYENINDDFNVEYNIVEFSSSILPLETYETVSFDIKKNDKKFSIETISGVIFFENIDDCNKKKHEVSKDVEKILTDYERQKRDKIKHSADPTGESETHSINYWLKSGDFITLICTDWSKTLTQNYGWSDNFSIEIKTGAYNNFLRKLYEK